MKSWLRLAAFSLLLSFGQAATAGGSEAGAARHLQWQCWYDLGEHVRCMIDARSSTADFEVEAVPAGLPYLIQALWSDGIRKSTIRFTLDDHSRRDHESLLGFAKASVCGAYRNCAVALSPRPPTAAQYIAMVKRNDPAAAMQLADAMRNWPARSANTELALAMPY